MRTVPHHALRRACAGGGTRNTHAALMFAYHGPMPEPFENLTWSMLLAHWAALAKVSVALPKNEDGDRWRAAVTSIVSLQAVTFALRDLDRLADRDERSLALDKAEMLIRRDAGALHELWRGEPLHHELSTLIDDAKAALRGAKHSGTEWTVAGDVLVADHPADLVETLLDAGFDGDLYVPSPGVPLFKTCPAAFARLPNGGPIDPALIAIVTTFLERQARPSRVTQPRLAYRQFDFSRGGPVRDLVRAIDDTLPAGQPLLVPALLGGESQPVSLPPRNGLDVQMLPVEFE
mgnify:CR=1 FL=1